MHKWSVFYNSGYRYEYETEVSAANWVEARKLAKKYFGGDYKSRDFKVSKNA